MNKCYLLQLGKNNGTKEKNKRDGEQPKCGLDTAAGLWVS